MEFPIIKNEQVVLMMAEKNTGTVLNINLATYREDIDNGPVYMVFDNLEKAHDYINTLKVSNQNLEFVLYNHQRSVIDYICE